MSGVNDGVHNKLPTVLLKKNIKVVKNVELLKCFKNSLLYKEDIIYESKPGDFLKQDTEVTLLNKLSLITNSSHTVARFAKGKTVERTSENITRLIGQSNYDILFSALCSVISQELKIRGILSLLTVPKKTVSSSCQTETNGSLKRVENKACQTDETCIDLIFKENPKKKRHKRQQLAPYVVVSRQLNKVKINPENFKDFTTNTSSLPEEDMKREVSPSPLLLEENSNDSTGRCSTLTVNSWPELLTNPYGIIENIQKVTKPDPPSQSQQIDWGKGTLITLLDGTEIKIPFKIEDHFHIATPEIIKYVEPELRRKVLWYQAYIDWKFCLTFDEDNHLPIHLAAMNGDLDMLRRQCVVLKTRQESVDITTGDSNMTALQISIHGEHAECTAMLLHFGADALTCDEEYRTCFHLAAEANPEHLKALIKHCEANPMKILQENEEIWKPELASKPKDYLTKYLLRKITTIFDNQGYTPLMLACKFGKYENVKTFLEAIPETVNVQMPNSGDTALYLAVSVACFDSTIRSNKSVVVDKFKKTVELLVEYGADPSIDNHSGSNVNTILTDSKVGELSMIIANKLTSINCYNGGMPDSSKRYDNVMLLKADDGSINVKEVKEDKVKPEKVAVDNLKPVILENITIDPDRHFFNILPLKSIFPVRKKETVKKFDVTPEQNKDVSIENNDKDKPNLFMNTFKNFVEDIRTHKIASPLTFADPNKPRKSSTVKHTSPVINDPSKVINEPSKVINDPSKVINEPSKVINEPSKVIDPSKVRVFVNVSKDGVVKVINSNVSVTGTKRLLQPSTSKAEMTNASNIDAETSSKRKKSSIHATQLD